jgi:hypothetical protein
MEILFWNPRRLVLFSIAKKLPHYTKNDAGVVEHHYFKTEDARQTFLDGLAGYQNGFHRHSRAETYAIQEAPKVAKGSKICYYVAENAAQKQAQFVKVIYAAADPMDKGSWKASSEYLDIKDVDKHVAALNLHASSGIAKIPAATN